MNHYTSIGFRWYFGGKTSGTGNKKQAAPVTREAITERISPIPSASALPEIDITIPYRDPFVSNNRNINVTARFMRISSQEDIKVKLNGNEASFEFFPEAGKIEMAVEMINDTSILSITGRNKEGIASDDIVLIYREQSDANKPAVSTVQAAVTLPTRVNQASTITENTRVNQSNRVNQNIQENRSQRTQNTIITQENPEAQVPQISFINPPSPLTVNKNIFSIKAKALNVKAWQDVQVVINGSANSFFNFTSDGTISLNIGLKEGVNEVMISGSNEAGTAREKTSITYKKAITTPAIIPTTNIVPATDTVTTSVVVPTTNIIPVTDTVTTSVVVPTTDIVPVTEITPTTVITPATVIIPNGIRINPGNSDWQFCLVTPSGTYNRSNLSNSNFRYSGSASSLYFKPIGGGGEAIVKGQAYRLSPGKDYLFTGSLTVTVSTSNPGSMGHWSVCIESDKEPLSGSGKNRPASPCEQTGGKKK